MKFIKLIFISTLLCVAAASYAQKPKDSSYHHKKDSLTAKKDSLNSLRDSLMEVSKQRREFLYAEKASIMLHDAPFSEEALKDLYKVYSNHSLATL